MFKWESRKPNRKVDPETRSSSSSRMPAVAHATFSRCHQESASVHHSSNVLENVKISSGSSPEQSNLEIAGHQEAQHEFSCLSPRLKEVFLAYRLALKARARTLDSEAETVSWNRRSGSCSEFPRGSTSSFSTEQPRTRPLG